MEAGLINWLLYWGGSSSVDRWTGSAFHGLGRGIAIVEAPMSPPVHLSELGLEFSIGRSLASV